MTIEILMPALSPTMEEGTLSKWLVEEGDLILAGDLLAEIETDKATMEVEAVEEGKIGKLLVSEGTEGIKVNTPIAIMINSNDELKVETDLMPNTTTTETQKSKSKDETKENYQIEPNLSLITVREALRNAMAEEMRLDKKVFVMGEEVAEYQGAYKVTQGLLEEFGEKKSL